MYNTSILEDCNIFFYETIKVRHFIADEIKLTLSNRCLVLCSCHRSPVKNVTSQLSHSDLIERSQY